MEFSRSEYPAMLASLQPSQAVEVLNERIRHVGKLNTEVADWLQERKRIEELYATGLRKLAQKRPPDASSDLGIFTSAWQKLASSADTLAASHGHLASKIELDVEQPLRNFVSQNREIQAMSTISGNLAAMAKEIDSAQKKADKLQSKGGKASTDKMAGAASGLESANAQWESQAPYVFEKLQAVDESRLNFLRDVLTQFQTHEVDQVERSRVTAEECLNALLTVETADEIKLFQIRATQGRPALGGERRERRLTIPGSSSAPSNDAAPPLPTPRAQDDNALSQTLSPPTPGPEAPSERDGSVDQGRKKSIGFGGGLKRLGTVIGRTPKKETNKEKASPYARPEPPERKSSSNLASVFPSLGGRGKSRGRDSTMPPPAEVDEATRVNTNRSTDQPGPQLQPLSFNDNVNGFSGALDEISPAPRVNGNHLPTIDQEPLQPTSMHTSQPTEPARDAEGFSVAPSATDAITQAEQDAAAAGGAGLAGADPALKFDIRNAPIQEEDTAGSQAAFDNMANTLRAQAPPPTRKTGTVRGRRDVRNTIFVPTPEASSVLANAAPEGPTQSATLTAPGSTTEISQSSPFKASTRLASDDPAASDTQSVRSGRSLASTISAIRHPDLHEPGLNSSIVESVSATFEGGAITKAMMIGEIALAYNPSGSTAASESIRLNKFDVLNKVAPNPAFIEQVEGKSGYYTVSLPSISRTTVAFKYQVHHDESTSLAKHVPLLLSSQWKIEPTQASAIVVCELNPNFAGLEGRDGITLFNVAVILHLDPSGARASNAKAANGGTFMRERSAVYWRLGEITLTKAVPSQQLRARFFTEEEAKPGATEARWEVSSENAVGMGSGLDVAALSRTDRTESDPFADEGAVPTTDVDKEPWKPVHGVRGLRSGTVYTAT